MIHTMPDEIKALIEAQAGPATNNARSLIRRKWERIKHLHPSQIINIIKQEYGIEIQADYDDRDWGEDNQKS